MVETRVCMQQRTVISKGVWFGDNPLDFPYPLMLAEIILVVLASRALYFLLKPLGQTKLVCNLLAGIILGSSLFGGSKVFNDKLFAEKAVPVFDTMAHLGVIYSIFLIALKFDVTIIRKAAKDGVKVGLATLIFPSAVSSSLLYAFGTKVIDHGHRGDNDAPNFFSLFAVINLSYSYFPVIAQAMDELNLMTSELGQFAMSSAIVTDVVQWFFAATSFALTQNSIVYGLEGLCSLFGLIAIAVCIIRPIMLRIIDSTPEGEEVKEMYIVGIQVGTLVISLVTDTLGLSSTTGAMILGLVIPSGPPLGTLLVHKTETMVTNFLLPMFFYRVGFAVDVYSIHDWTSFSKLQLVITMSYASKILGTFVAAFWCKFGLKNSLMISLAMNIKGILEVIVYSRWTTSKLIDDQSFTQIVLSMAGFMMILMPLLHFGYNRQVRLGAASKCPRLTSIQSMTTNSGTFRVLCCFHLEESVRNMITLLEASYPTEASPISAYVVHAVELMGRAAPELVFYKKLKRTRTPTHQMMRAFENYSQNSRGPVTIQAYNLIAPYRGMHETVIRLAHDKLVPLVILPLHDYSRTVDLGLNSAIRQFNINVQTYSECTVGILVDKGTLSCRSSLAQFSCSYNVGVFFIGGPDDREALAYAARMSGNPDVNLTVFRIILRNQFEDASPEEQLEAKLDKSLIEEFKLRNSGNDRLTWRDIEVDDGVQLMNAVRNSEGNYDLVMVGRRHREMSLRDEEMGTFLEHAELGVIGDMLASSDFGGGTVDVLVMQESRGLSGEAFHNDSAKVSDRST